MEENDRHGSGLGRAESHSSGALRYVSRQGSTSCTLEAARTGVLECDEG